MRMQPTDGFVALAIPFFAVSWLPEQANPNPNPYLNPNLSPNPNPGPNPNPNPGPSPDPIPEPHQVGGTTDSIAAFLASGARGEGDAVSHRGDN